MTKTNTTTHLYLDEAVGTDPLRCDHGSGEVSMRLAPGPATVWLTGTPADWRAFADRIVALTDEITRDQLAEVAS